MVMENLEAPHHLLLLRYFLAQGLAHGQPLLFVSPLQSPRAFLSTLPALADGGHGRSMSDMKTGTQGEDLRIAWQYRRYLSEQQELEERRLRQQKIMSQSWNSSQQNVSSYKPEYTSNFDLRKLLERELLNSGKIECLSLQEDSCLATLKEKCATFLSALARSETGTQQVGRIALQSLCAPQCMRSCSDWEMLAFVLSLKGSLRKANAVAFITFPASLMKSSFCIRWQHLSDILLSVGVVNAEILLQMDVVNGELVTSINRGLEHEDRKMEAMLTGYRDMIGYFHVHKLASINTQVPVIPAVGSVAIKVLRKREVVLDRLQLAPVDASGGGSGSAASLLCAGPANASSTLDF